ncbi:MAG: 3-oxoacyl-ACP reductase FabG [Planctomycetes bacterium]|nr:3-oxoacyl-ACP reductase FabG [Planctomycetota bacterium]
MKELEGKGAIVTGGSVGIGASIALDLARNGANVAINYRKHADEANKIVEEIKKMGRKGLAIQADVAKSADAEKMVQSALKEFGRLDILVNNAGINQDSVVWKMTEEQWDNVMSINLKGCFNYIHAVVPLFKTQNSGKIINITSINGLRGKFGQSNYSASKAGIIGLTKSVARELGKFSVNVNAVAPGLIETDMVVNAPEEVKQKALAEIVLGRIGKPDEVAWVVSFLASDKARHITGEVIKVDGGQYI